MFTKFEGKKKPTQILYGFKNAFLDQYQTFAQHKLLRNRKVRGMWLQI